MKRRKFDGNAGIVAAVLIVASLRNRRNGTTVGEVITLCICIGFRRLAKHIVGIGKALRFHLGCAFHGTHNGFAKHELATHFLHRAADGGANDWFT